MSTAPSHFSGSWRTSTIALAILSLGLIATLVTVGFMKGVDALSALALTLAVIAFIAQLVIYAIQTMHSGAQLREAQQLNTQTREMISDVRSRIDTTYQMVSSHNDVLLKMSSIKTGEAVDIVRTPTPATETAEKSDGQVSGWRTRAAAEFDNARVLPSVDECLPALETLESLPDGSVTVFSLNAVSDYSARVLGSEPGIIYTPQDDELIEAGLIERTPQDQKRVRLTTAGKVAGRLFTGAWPPGDEYAEIRDRILEQREKASPSGLEMFTALADTVRPR